MINRPALLKDLQGQLRKVEADLRQRHDEMPEIRAVLEAEYKKAKAAERMAQNYEDWLSDYATQVAAAWVLSCVFARFLEDNKLVEPPKMAGPTSVVSGRLSVVSGRSENRLARARDEHEMFFRVNPTQTDRDYLLWIFAELGKLPGCREIFDPVQYGIPPTTDHGPLTTDNDINWLGPDAAGELPKVFPAD